MRVRLEYKREDCWVGVYWQSKGYLGGNRRTDVWVCLLPMLPLHLTFGRGP